MTGQEKIYQMVTDRILEELEKGKIPWKKPWNGDGEQPQNLVSKKPYRGINSFMLACASFGSPYWVSFKQAKQKGGKVKKGEKGYPVIFWKFFEKQAKDKQGLPIFKADGTPKINKIPMLRYYTVFNAEQCEGLKLPEPDKTEENIFTPIEKAEKIAAEYKNAPEILPGNGRAYYSPGRDVIGMPEKTSFESPELYYSVLFHEMGHSTGSKTRLNREGITEGAFFGSHNYSKEELVAEFTAAFLCGEAGIEQETIENSAAYIQGWSRKIKDNPKWAVKAAGAAQKAADHIRGREYQKPA